jgi:tetratricopeptide (TPR) repeat protein
VLVAPAARGSAGVDWQEVERLEAAGDLTAALQQLESAPVEAGAEEALRRARTGHRLLHGLGRFDEAQRAGQGWIEVARSSGDAALEREAYHQTGRSLASLDRHEEAGVLFREAMARLAADTDEEVRQRLQLDLAATLVSTADLAAAQALLDEVEEAHGPKDGYVAYRLWLARAHALGTIGDLRGAVVYGERALTAAETLGDEQRVAIAAVNLGQNAMQVHDYARALTLYQRALELEPPTDLEVIAITSSGICHFELNQLDAARQAFEHARGVARELGRPALEAWASGELGLVAWQQGEAAEAFALFDRAIAISRQRNDPRNESIWQFNKGLVRRDQGRCEEAFVFYRRALELEKQIAGLRPNANLRKHMGQCHAALGDDRAAAALFDEALRLAEDAGDEKVLWETDLEIARLRRRAGDLEGGAEAYERSLEGIDGLRGSLQLESFKTDFFEDKVEVYTEYVAFLAAEEGLDDPERAFEIAERARARAFLDSLVEARAELDETLPSHVLEEERMLLARVSSLQAAMRRGRATPERRRELAQGERELEAFHLRIRSQYPRFRDLRYPGPVDLGEVQRSLAPGEVLLEYLLAEPVSHLWMIRSGEILHRTLPSSSTIEEAVRGAYGGLLSPEVPPDLGELSTLLLGAVSHSLSPPPASLIVVSSGILHYFPFETLPTDGRGGPLLGELAPTSYLPSAAALVELGRRERREVRPRLLALGDADYGGAAATSRIALLQSENLGALPHTRSEVATVRGLFGRGASMVLLGRQATEARFKAQELATYSVIHLATHGFIDASSPSRSGLVLGLAEGDGEDGILQFREVLRLPLAAELVTLSACKSALGELVTGEGIVGLGRSFFYAGADAVVASLWSVDDEATAAFMASFYRALRDGAGKAEALQRARLETRSDPRWGDPYYWAPYVLLGRGGDGVSFPPRRPLPTSVLVGGLLVSALLLLCVGALMVRRRSGSTPTRLPTRSRR